MDWSLARTNDRNELPPPPAKAHWSTLLSTGYLLDAAAEEWRPSIRLMRRVSSALGWKHTCDVLGHELVAITGAGQVTLCIAPDAGSELQALPLIGEPLPAMRLPSAVGAISVDEGAVVIRLSVKPASFLLMSKPKAEEAIKAIAILAPELGELLAARLRLSNDDRASQVARCGPLPDGIGTFRRQLDVLADKWEQATQQLVDIKAMELEAWRRHSKAALDAAWLQHDVQLEALGELSRERKEAWSELLQEFNVTVNRRLKQAEERLAEWTEPSRQEIDAILERLSAIEVLLAELGAHEATIRESA